MTIDFILGGFILLIGAAYLALAVVLCAKEIK